MAWIESHQSLSRHRKTLKTAGRLAVDRHKLIGHLHELWWWGLDNVGSDGWLDGMTAYEIALAAQWDGDPEEFLEALIDGGFIDQEEEGLALHDWYDYAGKLIDGRKRERERSRARRIQAKQQQNETAREVENHPEPQTDQRTTGGQPADDQEKTDGTIPYHTKPYHTKDKEAGNKFPPDSIPWQLAEHLRHTILAKDPNTKTPTNLNNWATEADRMIRLDNRDPQEAAHLMIWAQQDSFWHANILSMATFRKQYDKLKRQATSRKGANQEEETAAQKMLKEAEWEAANIIDVEWDEPS